MASHPVPRSVSSQTRHRHRSGGCCRGDPSVFNAQGSCRHHWGFGAVAQVRFSAVLSASDRMPAQDKEDREVLLSYAGIVFVARPRLIQPPKRTPQRQLATAHNTNIQTGRHRTTPRSTPREKRIPSGRGSKSGIHSCPSGINVKGRDDPKGISLRVCVVAISIAIPLHKDGSSNRTVHT